jgi:hypothetical protein
MDIDMGTEKTAGQMPRTNRTKPPGFCTLRVPYWFLRTTVDTDMDSFSGSVDRDTVSDWKCRREGDEFVCRAID